MPEKKVNVAIFDKDLKANVGKYPLNSDGTKIEIKSGGEGHFMPSIDNESFIEFPRPWYLGGGYKRVYFAMKWSRKCVNFHTAEVEGPDPKQVMDAANKTLLDKLGDQKQEVNWWQYLLIGINVLILLKVLGVLA